MMTTRTGKTFIIQTDDGTGNDNVFLTWDTKQSFYTTVDWVDEIHESCLFNTIEEAISIAKEADSSTFGGWNWASMKVMELLNFDKAYNSGEDPELVEVQTITF